jgi:uroporphyrinogen decarboxylase
MKEIEKEVMQPWQRVMMAVNHKEPDRVPFDLGATESSSISLKAYSVLRHHFGLPDKEPEILSFGGQLAQPDTDICKLLGVDTRRITRNNLSSWKLVVKENEDAKWFSDEWGAIWKMPKKDGHYFDMVANPLRGADFDAVHSYKWPDGNDPALAKELADYTKKVFSESHAALVLDARIGNGFFHTGAILEGYEDFFVDLAYDPDKVNYIMDHILELKLNYFNTLLEEIGNQVHIIRELDDLGSQQGLLISPEMYREFIKPREKKLFEFIKRKAPGVKILFHSCGSVYDIIPDLIEIGVDILNPVQVTAASMDSARLKREFGSEITFWGGGIDTQQVLPHGTPQEVRDEVKRRIDDFAPGGGFVFATVHNIQEDVPVANVIALWETLMEYGVYHL